MSSLTFVFWNVQQNQSSELANGLLDLITTYQVDVLVLCECPPDVTLLLQALGSAGAYREVPGQSRRIRFVSRFPPNWWQEQHFDGVHRRLAIQRLTPRNLLPILVAGVHLPSKINAGPEDRAFHARDVSRDLRMVEQRTNLSRTILLGDFNMNPHEPGMVEPDGFHAQLTRDLTDTVPQRAGRHNHSSFFNPMWNLWGEGPREGNRPPGSYFFADASRSSNHFWQIYDQILLRPELMRYLDDIRILNTTGKASLVTQRGRPASRMYTDHLPVLCRLTFGN